MSLPPWAIESSAPPELHLHLHSPLDARAAQSTAKGIIFGQAEQAEASRSGKKVDFGHGVIPRRAQLSAGCFFGYAARLRVSRVAESLSGFSLAHLRPVVCASRRTRDVSVRHGRRGEPEEVEVRHCA